MKTITIGWLRKKVKLLTCKVFITLFTAEETNVSGIKFPTAGNALYIYNQRIADNLTSMKRMLHRRNLPGQKAGLYLHARKTRIMHTRGYNIQEAPPDVEVNGIKLENVEHYKC